ncbi:alpha/beta fold hydrolase [Anaeromicropila herbilytica]|uniref:Carboxylesterase YbfK n=1 Tax=Anaeromicropila herbilytica TaxID=2785025 RepID=A0A7R7IDC3_9FIRM|nr:alpha/beta hydrolase [Anaeromicropila herbilytica]BCN30904.1 carboxylesterase YbfK [Anaeromicropila herbilytica]
MKSIYKNEKGKTEIIDLYNKQLQKLGVIYKDIYVDTSFGKTHLIETGNLNGKPLLVFHGGNSTTAYNLLFCDFLLEDFHIYAVDTIGHPGKSAEVSLSSKNQDYGKWASEVITGIGYEKIACFGGSFGAGVLVKTMCVSPQLIERSALLVPSAICNAPAYKSMNMLAPMILYWITHKRSWFIRCILPMAITEENILDDIIDTAKCSIDNAKIKTGMPSNESDESLSRYKGPVLIMSAEKDCLFPGQMVIERAKKIWKHANTYLLKDRGHIHVLTEEEKNMLKDFLLG